MKPIKNDDYYLNIKNILQNARDNAYRQVNFIMVEAYWNIGQQIIEEEQNGKERAEYGSYLIKELSSQLTEEFGKGFTTTNLKMMRQFYQAFPNSHTLCSELSWSHYVLEFLDLKQNNSFYESDLESALIEKIQEFLLELGRGFAFVARQK